MPKSKKPRQLEQLNEVDTLDEYAQLKTEITDMVKAAGVDARLELTGDHSYDLEADGTIWMIHGGQRRAVNTWRTEEWNVFREDMSHNRLRERIAELAE